MEMNISSYIKIQENNTNFRFCIIMPKLTEQMTIEKLKLEFYLK